MNWTSISRLIVGGIFLLAGLSLKKNRHSKLLSFYFYFLTFASYSLGLSAVITDFGFLWEGRTPVSWSSLGFWFWMTFSFGAVFYLTRFLLLPWDKILADFISRIFTLWSLIFLFLLGRSLPWPQKLNQQVFFWDTPDFSFYLLLFLAVFWIFDALIFLYLAAPAKDNKLKLRGFFLSIGIFIYLYAESSIVLRWFWISPFLIGSLHIIGGFLMFLGVIVFQEEVIKT